jgi:hypothetical protein
MKKSDITASLLIIITCVLLVIFLGLRSIEGYVGGGGTPPSYRFLAGRNPITLREVRKRGGKKRYTYSFEADFNDVCSKADAELIPAGFVGKTLVDQHPPGNKSFERSYWLKNRFPRGDVWIYINNNHQYIELPNSKKVAYCEKDGWVVVTVVYGQGWRWPF